MSSKKVIYILLFLLLRCNLILSQNIEAEKIRHNFQNTQLIDLLKILEKDNNIRFFYKTEWIKDIQINFNTQGLHIESFLKIVLDNKPYSFIRYSNNYYILLKNEVLNEIYSFSKQNQDSLNVEKNSSDLTKTKYRLSGTIKDAKTNESIYGANIFIEDLKTTTSTSQVGFYELFLPSGIYTITVQAIGKEIEKERIFIKQDKILDFNLFETSTELDEITISSQSDNPNLNNLISGVKQLDIKTIKSIPAFLGETDIVRSLILLPGISTVGEGATGFNVRGGNVDQNLILLDEAPILNSSHLFGFFSVFNPDVVQSTTLFTGGIPAQYGGRVSSILDVKTREGNLSRFSTRGGIGLISSRLLFEGPIKKEKISFLLAGRAAYPNWIIRKVPDNNVKNSSAFFYDLNYKIDFKLNNNNQIHFSGYSNKDGFRLGNDTSYYWGTKNLSLKWNSNINKKIFFQLTGIYSVYDYEVVGEQIPNLFKLRAGVENKGSRLDFNYSPSSKHTFDWGLNATFYNFNLGNLEPKGNRSNINPLIIEAEKSQEWAIYFNHEYKVNNQISLMYGLRYSQFFNVGPGSVFVYPNGTPRRIFNIQDTLFFENNKLIKPYNGFEPRLSFKLSINPRNTLKLGYHRSLQYIHLISNTTAVTPIDLWKSSDSFIPPQIGDQIALGYVKTFFNNLWELSLDVYYKKFKNLIDYKEGARLLLNPALEADLLTGVGFSYGIEFLMRKYSGKFNGWLSYTYSRTLRKFDGNSLEEDINFGKYFPANFDKPHNLSLVLNYKITKRFSFSSIFSFSTGRPISYPESIYLVDGSVVFNFSNRNQFRIPDYHRLDISFTLDGNHKAKNRYKGSWTFGIYNLYGRKNPFSVFFTPQSEGKILQANRLAILGTVFPALTYNFNFQ
jgi:hypothetical protein